jgi:hypothetical protein
MAAHVVDGLPPIVELAQGADFITARANDGSVWVLRIDDHARVAEMIDIRRLAADGGIACGLTGTKTIVCAMLSSRPEPPSWWANAKLVSDAGGAQVRELALEGEYADLTLGKDALCALTAGGDVDCLGNAVPETFSGLVVHGKALTRIRDLPTLESLNLFHRSSCWRTRGEVVHCAHGHAKVDANVYLPDVGHYPEWSLKPSILADGTSPLEAASTDGFACVQRADQTLWCVGVAEAGELPAGTAPHVSPRQIVSGISDAVGLHVGATSTCVRRSNGKVSCWGWGAVHSATPIDVPELAGALDVAVGAREICAVLPDGHARCRWIENGSVVTRDMSAFTDAIQISGDHHFCARTKKGEVWCWTVTPVTNPHLTLGSDVRVSEQGVPHLVPDVRAIDLVVAGKQTCAVTLGHTILCWGVLTYDLDLHGLPWPISLDGDLRAISLGHRKCVRLATGDWSCVGLIYIHASPHIPAGTPPPRTPQFETDPTFASFDTIVMRAPRLWPSWTCGLGASGDALCNTIEAFAVKHPLELRAVRVIGSGRDHICALHVNGTVECVGSNAVGQQGNGAMGAKVSFPM